MEGSYNNEQPDNTVVIMPDHNYESIQKILWPTSEDLRKIQNMALNHPPAPDMQFYYVQDLDNTAEKQTKMESFIVTCQQYLLNTLALDTKRSQENWLHALIFNYDRCGMDIDLKHAIEFVLRKYEPLHLKETDNATAEWTFIQQAFNLTLKSKHPQIKIFLLLALMSRETELATEIEKLCPHKSWKLVYPSIQQLVEDVVMSPYNRTNIGFRIRTFLYHLCNLSTMHIIPGTTATNKETPSEQNEEVEQVQKEIEDMFNEL